MTTGSGSEGIRFGASFRGSDALCPDGIRDQIGFAIEAERLGFHDFDCPEQIIVEDEPPEMPSGRWRWGVDSSWPDPLTLLAGVATVTSVITLTTSILLAPLRPAVGSAKAAATLDQLSAGRLRLGVGAGWQKAEFDASGVPLAGRTARMVDTIGAWRALWEQGPASFESKTVSFHDVWCRPGPYLDRRIPVLFAGPPTAALAARIAAIGDGWNPLPKYRAEISEGRDLIRAAYDEVGRADDDLQIRVPFDEPLVQDAVARRDASALRENAAELAAAGVTDIKIYIAGIAETPADVAPVMAWLAQAVELAPRG
jgi:probable F420-dependent oxidoreductase